MTNGFAIYLSAPPSPSPSLCSAITNKLRYLSTTTDILSDEPSTIKDEVMKVINRASSVGGGNVIAGGGVGSSSGVSPQQQQPQQSPSSSSSAGR